MFNRDQIEVVVVKGRGQDSSFRNGLQGKFHFVVTEGLVHTASSKPSDHPETAAPVPGKVLSHRTIWWDQRFRGIEMFEIRRHPAKASSLLSEHERTRTKSKTNHPCSSTDVDTKNIKSLIQKASTEIFLIIITNFCKKFNKCIILNGSSAKTCWKLLLPTYV